MDDLTHAATWATCFRVAANCLTVLSAFAWLKFADLREGCLSAMSLHHKVYLRILITLSTASLLCFCVSLVAAAKNL